MGWANEDGGKVSGLFISKFYTEYGFRPLENESYAPKPPLVSAGYNVKSI